MLYSDFLKRLPTVSYDREYREALADFDYKTIVLDDDPTGTQTVNNISAWLHSYKTRLHNILRKGQER